MLDRVKLTTQQAAKVLGIHVKEVARLFRAGELEGGQLFIFADSVDDYQRRHKSRFTIANPEVEFDDAQVDAIARLLIATHRRLVQEQQSFQAAENLAAQEELQQDTLAAMSYCRALGDPEFKDPAIRALARELAGLVLQAGAAVGPGERALLHVQVADTLRGRGKFKAAVNDEVRRVTAHLLDKAEYEASGGSR